VGGVLDGAVALPAADVAGDVSALVEDAWRTRTVTSSARRWTAALRRPDGRSTRRNGRPSGLRPLADCLERIARLFPSALYGVAATESQKSHLAVRTP